MAPAESPIPYLVVSKRDPAVMRRQVGEYMLRIPVIPGFYDAGGCMVGEFGALFAHSEDMKRILAAAVEAGLCKAPALTFDLSEYANDDMDDVAELNTVEA